MSKIYFISIFLVLGQCCLAQVMVYPEGSTICDRFEPPRGYERMIQPVESYDQFLRNLPLKVHESKVAYYNGKIKSKEGVYVAVIDLPIGRKDLHQCADAVMRLRAEYLWSKGQEESIHFNLTNGDRIDYARWKNGDRIKVTGNDAKWVHKSPPSNTYDDFWNYMELIFMYAGTASLEKELESVSFENMRIGDVLIQGGFPGHAVIVVDMAVHPDTKQKVYLLAQSYMPAQELQLLANPNNKQLSPWYALHDFHQIITPEWTFERSDLMRFSE